MAAPARSITAPGPQDEALAAAHARLLRDDSFQFDRVGFELPEVPGWLRWIGEAFQALAPVMQWLFWGALAGLMALLLFFIGREILNLRRPPPRPVAHVLGDEPDWRPDRDAARDLLAAADRLAAEGRYGEAAHLILLRSVEDIQSRRPKALRVSLTTREIARLDALPREARPAFRKIGELVERSLFGGAAIGPDAFADCRRAYEDFALPNGWSA
ncbi:DUF4129 domain-containing protein [Brevundimonas variabilis]|uniref:Protein-glutamine gamma-glutamyltransferase-like C-terminal domain-containing protein n=1 Tax=Brevundimonas variabilis TaxID=74312 RepID=A0A7W9CHL9_9CAUL|nr:DUF4129 domain-containing protein [Brevundimonas variabilis]MBB5745805.1 hypothetical protein [Brevundimonas variabilis]